MPYYPATLSERKPPRPYANPFYMRAPDKPRKYAKGKMYGRRWQKRRAYFLAKYPLCCECAVLGLTVYARVVDHIEPHRGDPAKFWCDDSGLQSLCTRHHDQKTGRGE